MPLPRGMKLGSYEITAALGTGGMGEVYRVRDTRLDRVVALKILRSDLSDNVELRGRFEREARVVASLNHPHICVLHDVGHEGGVDFLVLEYLEGETLAHRLAQGALLLDEALRISIEIASALAGAHRRGVIHRDLKPGNVMLTKFGAKLMDFGLARLRPGGGPLARELSGGSKETQEDPLTSESAVIGTFPYMAPEQIEGKEVDARADVFSAGVVLYEMLTGRRPFEADNPAHLIAAILRSEPAPMFRSRAGIPRALERVVLQCLAKDPDERWQSARDLELALRWLQESLLHPEAVLGGPGVQRKSLGWIAAAAATLAALGLGTLFLLERQARPPQDVIRFALEVPSGTTIQEPFWSYPCISPDGQLVAFTASAEETRTLWIRPLDAFSARLLEGTEGASAPFWSPDSRSVAFFADGKLKAISATGGVPRSLCDVAAVAACGTWGPDGTIVFQISEAPGLDGLYRVSASGGEPARIRLKDSSIGDLYFPHFLPDGRFLFLGASADGEFSIFIASLASETAELVPSGRLESRVEYSLPGYLLGVAENTLVAYEFDAKEGTLTGSPITVAENVAMFGPASPFSVSSNGVLVYRPMRTTISRLAWFDRSGLMLGPVGEAAAHDSVRLSLDGQRIAVDTADPRRGTSDLWILEFRNDASLRLTSDSRDELSPVWSPDGSEIAYSWSRDGAPHIFRMRLGNPEPELLVPQNGHVQWVCDWSPDSRTILYVERDPTTWFDLWTLDLDDDRRPVPWLQTPFKEIDARFSPDGHWIAYASDETGRYEVYVRPFSGPGEKRRLSAEGGRMPRWSRDGKELFYVDLGAEPGIVAVALGGPTADLAGAARTLFRSSSRVRDFDVTSDAQRFLINQDIDTTTRTLVHVVVNWTALLRP